MPNLNNRLARIERELAATQAQRDAPLIHELVLFVEKQQLAEQHSFWRVTFARYAPADRDARALELCGGSLTIQPGDEATYRRLQEEFFGGRGYSLPDPDPRPMPALEMA